MMTSKKPNDLNEWEKMLVCFLTPYIAIEWAAKRTHLILAFLAGIAGILGAISLVAAGVSYLRSIL